MRIFSLLLLLLVLVLLLLHLVVVVLLRKEVDSVSHCQLMSWYWCVVVSSEDEMVSRDVQVSVRVCDVYECSCDVRVSMCPEIHFGVYRFVCSGMYG